MHPVTIAIIVGSIWLFWDLRNRHVDHQRHAQQQHQRQQLLFQICAGSRWPTLTATHAGDSETDDQPISSGEFEEMAEFFAWDLESIPERIRVQVR